MKKMQKKKSRRRSRKEAPLLLEMGGYVPPHLRGNASDSSLSSSANNNNNNRSSYSSGRDNNNGDNRSGRSNAHGGGGGDTGGGYRHHHRSERREDETNNNNNNNNKGTMIKKWQPSERVLNLTKTQIEDMRERLNVLAESPEGDANAYAPIESFEDMHLDREIALSIKSHGFDKPTSIQAQGIPVILSGADVLGCAETGSGKTAAFAIPMIHYCVSISDAYGATRRGDGPTAIVLAPTRELAQQIEKETKAFSQAIDKRRFKTTIVVGGSSMNEQRGDLRSGVECVVATPGRLIDHIHQNNTNLRRASFLVLDEADRMLDMGFEQQILEILNATPKPRQTLLFSATMPPEVEVLAGEYLVKPVKVKVGTVSAPTANVAQSLEKVPNDMAKVDRLCRLLVEEKMEAVAHGNAPPMSIVFVERKSKAEDVADMLNAEGVATASLHGGRTQGEREAALRDFTRGLCSILVATDVAARGLDVKGVQHVVNMDLPRNFEDYVHRVGRTGRNGMTGRATSFYTDSDAFIVSQIKRALQELENGNAFAFATGKEARAREKEAQRAWKEERRADQSQKETDSGNIISVDDKFKSMLVTTSANAAGSQSGAADDAWGSDEDDF
jgi:ATP-dependent RNA helicase DDX5/DBP2